MYNITCVEQTNSEVLVIHVVDGVQVVDVIHFVVIGQDVDAVHVHQGISCFEKVRNEGEFNSKFSFI